MAKLKNRNQIQKRKTPYLRFMAAYRQLPDTFNEEEDLDRVLEQRHIATPRRQVLYLWRRNEMIRETGEGGWYEKTEPPARPDGCTGDAAGAPVRE